MKILVDNQYITLNNGEYIPWVADNIISNLSLHKHDIDYPKTFDKVKECLSHSVYDLIIVTGYDSKILSLIDNTKVHTKIACIIYDINAEQMLSAFDDNKTVSNVVYMKSHLIFLCNYIICANTFVRMYIENTFKKYESTSNARIIEKLIDIQFNYTPNDRPIAKRQIDGKYIYIHTSINGFTFVCEDFQKILGKIINANNIPDNLTIIIDGATIPKDVIAKIHESKNSHTIRLFTEISSKEKRSLFKHSLATFFISPINSNLSELCEAIECEALCIINEKNVIFGDFMEDSGIYFNPDDENYDIIQDAIDLLKLDPQSKNTLKTLQQIQLYTSVDIIPKDLISQFSQIDAKQKTK